ncbi:ABC transporter permease [Stieleria sp. JC731]|nr:ABC transporter permease [Stieleria sp. JC731]MCC9599229.1 ABC transporter permease [Stieleria sp. JC731]
MRAILTVIGVVIGIAAVTTIVSIGQGANRLVQGELQGLGTNVIFITPGQTKEGGVQQNDAPTLTASDADAIAAECPAVLAASPMVWTGGQVIFGNENWSPKEMLGVGPDFLQVRAWPLEAGSFFSDADVDANAKVCVIGQTLINKLFRTTNPIGQTVRINNVPIRVIGILAKKGANMVGDDQDNLIVMPQTTVRKRMVGAPMDNIHAIMVSARGMDQMGQATKEIRNLLLERHKIAFGDEADFEVTDMEEVASMLGIITGTLTLMLSVIAGISLVVGGVGIMNIMLVSVTERTREIGIRMALGARGRDILWQFLIESIVLSGIGGLIGLGLGTGMSMIVTVVINTYKPGTDWPMVVSIPAALVAMGFAAAVGMFFGFYPARRASKMDPIDALRYE